MQTPVNKVEVAIQVAEISQWWEQRLSYEWTTHLDLLWCWSLDSHGQEWKSTIKFMAVFLGCHKTQVRPRERIKYGWVKETVSTGFPYHVLMRWPKAEPRTNHHTRYSERRGGIGLDCLSVNPKRARMGSLWVLDCRLYILEYTRAAQGYILCIPVLWYHSGAKA